MVRGGGTHAGGGGEGHGRCHWDRAYPWTAGASLGNGGAALVPLTRRRECVALTRFCRGVLDYSVVLRQRLGLDCGRSGVVGAGANCYAIRCATHVCPSLSG